MPPLAWNDSDNTIMDANRANFEPQPMHRRIVNFSQQVHVYHVRHVNDFSQTEIDSTWYSADEFHNMTNSVRYTRNMIDLLTRAPKAASRRRDLCYSGVLSTRDFNHRRSMIFASVDAVLTEQDMQSAQGCFDENRLADTYSVHSGRSHSEDRERAQVCMEETA